MNEVIGGAVMLELGTVSGHKLRQDTLRQLLAQFHAPLVKGIHAPEGALSKDDVLIQGNERAKDLWG